MKLSELFEDKERSVLSEMGMQPEKFDKDFSCFSRALTSLEGSPKHVSGYFTCAENKLTSLEGAPSFIGKDFACSMNNLTSLHNIHKQIKHIGGFASAKRNPITSCVLGLLLIDGLKEVYLDIKVVEKIINKHLKSDRDVFACQEELIEHGYDEFAKL